MPKPRRFTRRKHVAAFCSFLFITFTVSAAFSPSAHADGPQASASPQAALRDRQVVSVSWSGALPGEFVDIRQCTGTAVSYGECGSGAGMITEESDNFGSGIAHFPVVATEGTENSSLPGSNGLSCGSSYPCQIVVSVNSLGTEFKDALKSAILFAPESGSCPTEGMHNITAGGTGALLSVIPNWQTGLCHGSKKVSLDYISTRGDEGGRGDYYCGLVDFAVSEIAGPADEKCLANGATRPSIYVPIANSALVFAYQMRNTLTHQFLPQLRLTPDMVASTLTGQTLSWGYHDPSDVAAAEIIAVNNPDSPLITGAEGDGELITFQAQTNLQIGDNVSISQVNPLGYNDLYTVSDVTLKDVTDPTKGSTSFSVAGSFKRPYKFGGLVNPKVSLPGTASVLGRADACGLNYLLTRFLLGRAAKTFHAAGPSFDESAFSKPSVFMPLSSKIDNNSFKSNPQTVVLSLLGLDDRSGATGALATMDAGAASYYGFGTASIKSADGSKFVAPTTTSIALGIDAMQSDSVTGVSSADLSPKNQNAYPLVFSVYAVVPKNAESTESADAIKATLEFVRDHSAQSELPNGYVALTSAQKQKITNAISSISGPAPKASPSASASSSASSSPSASASQTLPPDFTQLPVVDSGFPDAGGIATGVDGTGGSTDGGSVQQAPVALPSIFAMPFVPHNGPAAGILPALVLIGVSASAVGAFGKIKEGSK